MTTKRVPVKPSQLPDMDGVGFEDLLEQLVVVGLGLREVKGLDGDFAFFLLSGDDGNCQRIVFSRANVEDPFHR